MTDSDIWNHALEKDLIILTRDVDFYSRAMVAKKMPKIVYFNLGNVTLAQLHEYFNLHWKIILKFLESNQLIVATNDGIDVLI
jgi:predicted nuclease of predicted toxin-antitoxin system